MSDNPSAAIPAFSILPEPELLFHCDRFEDKTSHPLRGLVNFGPYSRSQINSVIDPVRVALIAPKSQLYRLSNLLRELESKALPKERKNYLIDFPGFSRVFGVRVIQSDVAIELTQDIDKAITKAEKPHLALLNKLVEALALLRTNRHSFDVAMLLLPSKWSSCFDGGESDDFDLHDFIKATTASWGIPIQIVLEDGALTYACRCSVMWHLGIAMYCKAGGVPWKLADSDPETAFIGLSYALKKPGDDNRFVTCCSQVFDSDGAGLEFLAYETSQAVIEQKNPFLNRSEMRKVMARSLMLYQKRHAGRPPKKLIVHKNHYFKNDEIEGVFDIFGAAESIDLLHVQTNAFWRGVKLEETKIVGQKSTPANYPCSRGTTLQLSGREVLLWTQGNAPTVSGKDFYKERRSIPEPLLLSRYAGHGSWDETCKSALALSKMDWNNDSLYTREPVTIKYARVLANIAKRMETIGAQPYEFRYFM